MPARNTDLVIETTRRVEIVEIGCICRTPPKVHVRYFKITPNCEHNKSAKMMMGEKEKKHTVAQVVVFTTIVRKKLHSVALCDVLRMVLDKLCSRDHQYTPET
jgi:hypothetical protein